MSKKGRKYIIYSIVSSPVINGTDTSQSKGVFPEANCTFNFYDGVIKGYSGTGSSIYDPANVIHVPSGYTINKTLSNKIETAILVSGAKGVNRIFDNNSVKEKND